MLTGRLGLLVRALMFSVVGYFLVRAALQLHARTAVAVDGALATVHRQAFGSWLLAVVAAGLFTFATFITGSAQPRRVK